MVPELQFESNDSAFQVCTLDCAVFLLVRRSGALLFSKHKTNESKNVAYSPACAFPLWVLMAERMGSPLGEPRKKCFLTSLVSECVPFHSLELKRRTELIGSLGTFFVLPILAELASALSKVCQTHGQPQLGCFKALPLTERKTYLLRCLRVKQDTPCQ